jgi:pSer/pThr/pTyr-binding forkhead associated (FHA) protein
MSHQSLNRFLGACRVTAPLELSVERPDRGLLLRRSFDRPFALVGRDPRADLPLEDEDVSQRHAYIQVVEGRVFAADLGSQTGTRWPDGSQHFGWLEPEQRLRIGPFQVVLGGKPSEGPRDDWNPLDPGSAARLGAPTAVLEFRNGNRQDARWRLDRALTFVGRTDGCHLQLIHASVSKTHCCLFAGPRGIWLIDLLARGGVRVNGRPVRWACLEDGDWFEVGEFTVGLRYQSSAADGPATPAVEEPRMVNVMATHAYLPARAESSSSEELRLAAAPPTRIIAVQAMPLPNLPARTEPAKGGVPVAADDDAVTLPAGPLVPTTGTPESLLTLFARQFALMQQQMFDQFQQSVMMMVQAFGALHRDQVGLVRGELDQLRQLTERLNELEMELVKHQGTPPAPVAAAAEADWPTLRLDATEVPAGARNGGKAARSADRATTTPAASPRAHGPAQAAPASPHPAARKPSSSGAAAGQPSAKPPEQDVHAWLSQQIAVLQQERQSVWQKLVGTLTGNRGAESLP